MGVSNTHAAYPVPAAVLSSTPPEVAVERGDDGQVDRVMLSGTMYHDGLNRNAWGLTETGAKRISDDLVGRDHVASHPMLRGAVYDRSITDGPGFPIGTVTDTSVTAIEGAMLDGGEYTAEYVTEITDPVYATRYAEGVYDGEDYSVSIGIYGDPEAAECSVCSNPMQGDDCDHSRGEEVATDEGEPEIAGPLYGDGEADHLASVYMAAYEGADADVSAASAEFASDRVTATSGSFERVPQAASVLAEPFDATDDGDDEANESAETATDKRPVRTRGGAKVRVRHSSTEL